MNIHYEAIPDGIGVTPDGKGTVDVFVPTRLHCCLSPCLRL